MAVLLAGCAHGGGVRNAPLRDAGSCANMGTAVAECDGASLLDLNARKGVRHLRWFASPDRVRRSFGLTLGVSTRVTASDRSMKLIAAATQRAHVWIEAVPRRYDEPSLDDDALARLGTVEGIEGLIVGPSATITSAGLIRFVRQQPGLRAVRLSSDAVSDDVLTQLGALPDLRLLDLRGSPVTDEGVALLGSLGRLELLDLSQTEVTDRCLASLSGLHGLRELRLGTAAEGAASEFSAAGFSALVELPRLTTVGLRGRTVSQLGSLAALPHIHTLDLSKTHDLDLNAIGRMSGLRRLDLSGAAIGTLEPLATLTGLEELDLSDTNVGDLRAVSRLKRLRRLDLDNSPVDPADFIHLHELPHLEAVRVSGYGLSCAAQTSLPLRCTHGGEGRTW